MNLQEVVLAVSQMQSDGVVVKCAIGGAVAATFYLETVSTLDVDIFVAFERKPGELFISLQPLFEYFVAKECEIRGEYLMIGGWPVQFLPAPTPLVEEALDLAIEKYVGKSAIRVFTAEHLAAIALQLGRVKDRMRLLQFIEAKLLDVSLFQSILERHQLEQAWKKFEIQFLSDPL